MSHNIDNFSDKSLDKVSSLDGNSKNVDGATMCSCDCSYTLDLCAEVLSELSSLSVVPKIMCYSITVVSSLNVCHSRSIYFTIDFAVFYILQYLFQLYSE